MTRARASIRDTLRKSAPGEWAARLSWLIVLLDPIGHEAVEVPLSLLALAGLMSRRMCWHPGMWFAATLCVAWPVLADPFRVDNHAYLRCYWFLALAIAALRYQPNATLARAARVLIAAVFGFALIWKAILSPDFMSGDYFRFTLLTDSRFAEFSSLVVGLSPEDQDFNRSRVHAALAATTDGWDKNFVEPPRVGFVARALTLWTLLVEGCIVLGFLLPAHFALARWRDLPLLVFGITTYAIASVEGFGWLLCSMGLAQSDAGRPGVRIAYLGCFALILCYARLPWISWLAGSMEP